MKRNTTIDWIRILAVLIVLAGIIFFHLNIFWPRLIPPILRMGMPEKPMNILLLGSDILYYKDTGEPIPHKGNSDTIVLLNINPSKQKINLISIPRDTEVTIKGYGTRKINAAFPFGGVSLSAKTVEDLIHMPIDHYINLEIKNIPQLINIIGGVYVYVDKDMWYVDHAASLKIDLKKGWQRLDGEEAHGFIRYRQDPEGDIARIRRQQHLAQAAMNELKKPSNIIKTPLMFKNAMQTVRTNLKPLEIIKILNFARMIGKENVNYYMLPGEIGYDDKIGSIWKPNYKEVQDLIKNLN